MTLHDILERFRQDALSNRDLGDRFERLIAAYLALDPIYADRFDGVWLWSEWPYRRGQDTGIDLVARERIGGDYCAIQCKFYDPGHTLQKADIDSFFTASGQTFTTDAGAARFASRLLVSTTDRWSKLAEDALADQTIPVTRLRVQDLAESPIDWSAFRPDRPAQLVRRARKVLRPHQTLACAEVLRGFETVDRGKLIMACGTGKTFVSLKIVEQMVQAGGGVLFLVPSISLLSQTLREWTAEAERPFHAFAVCSDTKVGRNAEDLSAHDLALPATTQPQRLADAVALACQQADRPLTVVFATYQSIGVVADAQRLGLPGFDLVVCDEAHRTTGVTLEGEEDSHFVRVHREDEVRSRKRLYMTATPRIFSDGTKSRADEASAVAWSMDDEAVYGPVFHRLGFGEAVSKGLLSDYKVLVLAVDEQHVSAALQRSLADANNEINVDDAVKIIGCWNGLAKRLIGEQAADEDPAPMHRAVAFTRSIRDSKHLATMFRGVVEEYLERNGEREGELLCDVEHVDGTFNVLQRNQKLDWLKADAGLNTCRILSNARCLSEGVDVPALDAVLFLNPRDSVVDVVQSVGRVMRRAEGKKYGYVILPIGVPAGIPPEIALQDNDRYRVVWQVLQALRAHDDRFNATVNQIELNRRRPAQISIIGVGGGAGDDGGEPQAGNRSTQLPLALPDIDAWKDAIYAKIVVKCGDRRYWEDWARDVARIAERHAARIRALLAAGGEAARAFADFLAGLQENINPDIDADEAIEMLSQHLITRPVFDALFEHYAFTRHNPVSHAMQAVLDVLEGQALAKEVEALQGFYDSVRKRVQGIDNAAGRQKVIVELYDRFFKQAFPKLSARLGIVYTPVEVVDFIVHSCEHALRTHFGVGLTDRGVHIVDPFTGTGTFIVRLLQSGLIASKDLERKYQQELHANEIVLLAYYIAAINIEATYHELAGGEYEAFEGIVLTDTFQVAEEAAQKGFGEAMFPENNQRVKRQKGRDIRVVMSNPPYSAQQDSQNDNNANLVYPILDERIRSTYAKRSTATLKNKVYDSYIRAIRWASDRLKNTGVIGFVTNGSFIDANNMDGLRRCLVDEFSTIYCVNLRGDQRTAGETSKREGGKIFGSGSRTPVAITILVKDSAQAQPQRLRYFEAEDYLSREAKLQQLSRLGSIKGVDWTFIVPNDDGDWVHQRSPEFESFLPLGSKNATERSVFSVYSLGVLTARDPWAYNFGRSTLATNMEKTVRAFNAEATRYAKACAKKPKVEWPQVNAFVDPDPKKIFWTADLKKALVRGDVQQLDTARIVDAAYRPFTRRWLYFDRSFNERVSKIPRLFPTPRHANVVISVIGVVDRKGFSVLAADRVPDLHFMDTGQCFPLYWYHRVDLEDDGERASASADLFSDGYEAPASADAEGYVRRDAITDWALAEFQARYDDASITKPDLFHYVYGVLHAPSYRRRFDASLRKMLPRIPFAATRDDFWSFSKAGFDLLGWHLRYESVEPYPLVEDTKGLALEPREHFRVEKMAFAKSGKVVDRSTIVFNSRVRLAGIPPEAYEYVVNGKSAIEWVMERYAVSVDKDSGLRNDPNDWSDDPRYVVNLVKRIVQVSLATVRIVKALPEVG